VRRRAGGGGRQQAAAAGRDRHPDRRHHAEQPRRTEARRDRRRGGLDRGRRVPPRTSRLIRDPHIHPGGHRPHRQTTPAAPPPRAGRAAQPAAHRRRRQWWDSYWPGGGVPSRSATSCATASRASRRGIWCPRPSIRRSTCKDAAGCAVNCTAPCAPAAPCADHAAAQPHQRVAAPVLSQGHRPVGTHRRRSRRRRG